MYKKPLDSSKASKKGRLKLIVDDNGTYHTTGEGDLPSVPDQLVLAYENGEIKREYTFAEVRKNAAL